MQQALQSVDMIDYLELFKQGKLIFKDRFEPVCYLLHFKPIGRGKRGRAGHYLGTTINLYRRIAIHESGHSDVKFMRAVVGLYGRTLRLVATWQGGRQKEIELKARKDAPGLCPICNPGGAALSNSGGYSYIG